MKNPNGYGTVVKLSGNRRKPYAVRKTVGITKGGYPKQKYLGYFKTVREAKRFLAEYNEHPQDTLNAVYEQCKGLFFTSLSDAHIAALECYFRKLEPLGAKTLTDIKPADVQLIINDCAPTVGMGIKTVWRHIEKTADFMGISSLHFADALITQHREPREKSIFSRKEIDMMWENPEKYADALILIYTGLRISEYYSLTPDSLQDGILKCGVKTENGKNRLIPIHPNILPLLKEKLENEPFKCVVGVSQVGLRYLWTKDDILRRHTFHECRHTFRSMLDYANANKKCIDLLMGHKSSDVGVRVYTHKTIQDLIDTVNLLK